MDISTIFNDLQRTHSQNPCEWSDIQNHRNFPMLCESTKQRLKHTSLPTNYVAILRTVQQLGLPVEHELTRSILRAILRQVSAMPLEDIFTLDRLVRESYNERSPNDLHEKLLLILPMVYQINYLDQIDYENLDELCSSLEFIANNFERIAKRAVSGVVTSLRLSGAEITPNYAIRIIASLSKLKFINAHVKPLLLKCIQIVTDAQMTPKEVQVLLNCLSQPNLGLDGFDDKFYKKCVHELIHSDCDVLTAFSIHQKFAELVSDSNRSVLWWAVIHQNSCVSTCGLNSNGKSDFLSTEIH